MQEVAKVSAGPEKDCPLLSLTDISCCHDAASQQQILQLRVIGSCFFAFLGCDGAWLHPIGQASLYCHSDLHIRNWYSVAPRIPPGTVRCKGHSRYQNTYRKTISGRQKNHSWRMRGLRVTADRWLRTHCDRPLISLNLCCTAYKCCVHYILVVCKSNKAQCI